MNKWNKDKIIEELRYIASKLKHSPTIGEVKKINSSLEAAIRHHFGNFNKVKKIASLKIYKSGKEPRALKSSFNILTPSLGYIIGVSLGDAYVGKGRIEIETKDKDFAYYFKKHLEEWSGIKTTFKKTYHKKRNKRYYLVTLSSIYACQYILNKISEIDWIYKTPKFFQIMVLKGLWDSEGTIDRYRGIRFCNSNYKIIELYIKLIMNILNITPKILIHKGKHYVVYFSKWKEIYKFYKIIGITIKRKERKIIDKIIKFENEVKAYYLIKHLMKKKKSVSKSKIRQYAFNKFKSGSWRWVYRGIKPILLRN